MPKIFTSLDTPKLSAAVEDATARKLPGDMSLLATVLGFLKQTQGITPGMTVPQIHEEFPVAKIEKGVSTSYPCSNRSSAVSCRRAKGRAKR